MQLPLPAGSYKHPSRPTNYQLCVNYFPTSPGPQGRGAATLLPCAGSRILNFAGADPVRMVKRINGIIYVVVGNKFYSLDIDTLAEHCTMVQIGTLNTTAGTVIATNNPNQILLVDGLFGYIYNYTFAGTVALGPIGGTSGDTYYLTINGQVIYNASVSVGLQPGVLVSNINLLTNLTGVEASYTAGLLTLTAVNNTTAITVSESGTGFVAGVDGITVNPGVFASPLPMTQFQQISNPDFAGGTHVEYIDGYFICNVPGTQKFQFSQPNEGRIWSSLDVASAESKPDDIIALGEAKSELWVFGTDSVEVWYDAGNPTGAPFSKRVGSDIDIGCKAPYSVTNINNLLVWVDSRGYVVQSDVSALFRDQSSGYTLTKISTEALDAEISTYLRIDDAIGTTYVDRGHMMYELTFPAAKKTWVYDYITQTWHERNKENKSTGVLEHSLNQYSASYGNYIICGGIRDGKIYTLRSDYYLDDGDPITRLFTTSHYQDDFKQMGIDSLELKMKTGFGETEGYLANTQVMMQYSHDSGYSWSNELFRPVGSRGAYDKRIIWNMLGSSNQWLWLFKITAPIDHAIVDLSVNINLEM